MYSTTLRELVMHCLMYEPLQVEVQELQARVASGRRACKEAGRDSEKFDAVLGAPVGLFAGVQVGSGEWILEPLRR